MLIRSLALVLISLVMYLEGDIDHLVDWSKVTPGTAWDVIGGLLKANLWEVLAIIGVTQILIMPVIAARAPCPNPGLDRLRNGSSDSLVPVQFRVRLRITQCTG